MTKREKSLREQVRDWPPKPGVYLMKNHLNQIIYIGKAKNLKVRIRSYFIPLNLKEEGFSRSSVSLRTQHFVQKIKEMEYVLTNTEVEAFLLEASLIKKHQPKYNIRLKDDKSYPYLCLSVQKDFPRFSVTRRIKNDGSFYFGPYTQVSFLREMISFMNKTFKIRDCSDSFMKQRTRPCLTYQMGFCEAPCVGWVKKESYQKNIKAALRFLHEGSTHLKRSLKERMKKAASQEKFELAARLRNNLYHLDNISKRHLKVTFKKNIDQDVVAWSGRMSFGFLIEILHLRKKTSLQKSSHFLSPPQFFSFKNSPFEKDPLFFDLFSSHRLPFSLKNDTHQVESQVKWVEAVESEWITSFLCQYYGDHLIPERILLADELQKRHCQIFKLSLEKTLQNRSALLLSPSSKMDQEDIKLLRDSSVQVQKNFQKLKLKKEKLLKGLRDIKEAFSLPTFPYRMEGFDVSHFQSDSVASQVVFEEGQARKSEYRHYKIKAVKRKSDLFSSDDFAHLKEVLKRRFQKKEMELPQLILIDGGKGQLNKALEVLNEARLEKKVFAVGIAKARTERNFQSSQVKSSKERFYLPGKEKAIVLPGNSEALHILVSLRNEAHRFALRLQKKQRDKKIPKTH